MKTSSRQHPYGRTFADRVASVEVLKRAYEGALRSPSPELEKKDEYLAASLWQVAAKSNQKDFKELFKNRRQLETSDEVEEKLKDLIKS